MPACDRAGVERIDEHRGVACDLLGRSARGRDDGGAARHRLEHRDAEALVERRIDDAARAAVVRGELVVVDLAEPAHCAARVDAAPAARADDAQLDAGPRGRVDRAREILARLERADGEHVVALRPRAVGREGVVDGVRDDGDLLARHAEELDELGGGELGDGDHACAARRTRGTTRGTYMRVQRGNASGWRSTARSCTVTTVGHAGGTGP